MRRRRSLTTRALVIFTAVVALGASWSATASAESCASANSGAPCELTTSIVDAAGQPVTSILVGSAVHPLVVVSARTTPTGTITLEWYGNGTCEGTPVTTSQPLPLSNGVVNGTQFAQIPRKVGAYAFAARYSGDANYAATTGDCRPLTVPKFAPRVLGSSVAINTTAGETVLVGATADFDVALNVTGDTTLSGLTVVDTFENEVLTLAGPLPAGCTVQAQTPDPKHDTITCLLGRVPLSAAASAYTQTLKFSFRAIRASTTGSTANSAQATFTFEGFGQSAPIVIGPSTASVQVVEAPRLALPAETKGTQGEEIEIPVRLRAESLRVPTTFTFVLRYDPTLLRGESVLPGDFASADGPKWTLTRPGEIAVSVVSATGASVTNGLGSLVRARFTVLGANGESTLVVDNVQAVPLQANGVPVSVDSGQGTFIVTPVEVPQMVPDDAAELPTIWDPQLWTPEHVTESLGYAAVLLVTLTVLAEVFNGTIEENRHHFPGWWRRLRSRGAVAGSLHGEIGDAGGRNAPSLASLAIRTALYLLAGSALFAFLRPERVLAHPEVALAGASFALVITTLASQLPRLLYVRFLHRGGVLTPPPHGHRLMELHAPYWTLLFACVCVAVAYITQVRPGYAYGIIGVLSVSRHVRVKEGQDRGQLQPWRMELVGMTSLFLVALTCWLAYSAWHGDHHGVIPHMLEEGWAFTAETLSVGLIPLNFLPGKTLWNWNRPVWGALWGSGLFLYIQSLAPSATGAGPLVIAGTILAYAAVTGAFWFYFAYMHKEESCESCRAGEPELVVAA